MTVPRATYRLQFRGDVDFERAANLVPYLARLGASHLYASPLFQAAPGSAHGYDVTDFTRFDDALGGYDKFALLAHALQKHGLGLIFDIVPNHMAASCHNPWWRDVLRHGRQSAYAGHFDIDWTQDSLLLPILDRPYGAALSAGAFALVQELDGPAWSAAGQTLPLDPRTWRLVLHGVADTGTGPNDAAAFRQWQAEGQNAARLAAELAAISRDAGRMHEIHEAQPWRLAYWRAARDMLGYRRFFEVADLVGLRIEEPNVFDDVHRFLFELIDRGYVDGLRIDHIDGLADPKAYLDRLNDSLPRPIPVWVEKILERREQLREDWRVAGATGYEFLAVTAAALTNRAAESDLDRIYTTFAGQPFDFEAMRSAAKHEVLTQNLATELETLVRLVRQAFAGDPANRDWGPDALRRALTALLAAMPVYRTYVGAEGSSPQDRSLIAGAVEAARNDRSVDDPAAVDAVAGRLVDAGDAASLRFATRFQQVSGALMAKAVEDTLFYRFNRLISANEVGADAGTIAISPDDFHAFSERRAAHSPAALNATATHDTKRGEDARMRIAAISEAPAEWLEATVAFDAILAEDKQAAAIDQNTRWFFYQALLGSWRADLKDDLPARIGAYMLKASREAKRDTSWLRPDTQYEEGVSQFVERALSRRAFVDAFDRHARRYIAIGERKSLAQLALKLTLPGVPDIYQRTEIADLSLVDPDNRRPVDFAGLAQRLAELEGRPADGFSQRKLPLLRFGLGLRRDHPDVFAGTYCRLEVDAASGQRLFAFAREGRAATLVVAVDLSGVRHTASETVELMQPAGRRLTRLIDTFPRPSSTDAPAAAADAGAQLAAFGVSLRLFASPGAR